MEEDHMDHLQAAPLLAMATHKDLVDSPVVPHKERLQAQILSKRRYTLCVVTCALTLSPRRLWNWFTAVDSDRSGHISAHELRE